MSTATHPSAAGPRVPAHLGSEPVAPGVVAAVDLTFGVGSAAVNVATRVARRAARVARPVVALALRPPLLDPRYRPDIWVQRMSREGHRLRLDAGRDVARLADTVVPLVVAEVLARLDLTAIVQRHVGLDTLVAGVDLDRAAAGLDVDAVAARLDVDAVAARIDVEALLDRIDLVGLAEEVIDAIDLPEIIRESTGSVASETVRGVRMRSVAGDEAIGRAVDRLLLRRRARATQAPGAPLPPSALPPGPVLP